MYGSSASVEFEHGEGLGVGQAEGRAALADTSSPVALEYCRVAGLTAILQTGSQLALKAGADVDDPVRDDTGKQPGTTHTTGCEPLDEQLGEGYWMAKQSLPLNRLSARSGAASTSLSVIAMTRAREMRMSRSFVMTCDAGPHGRIGSSALGVLGVLLQQALVDFALHIEVEADRGLAVDQVNQAAQLSQILDPILGLAEDHWDEPGALA